MGVLFPFFLRSGFLIRRQKGSVKILIYHDVSYDKIKNFSRQIASLKRHYSFIDPDLFHAFLKGEIELSKTYILITFDDGFKSSRIASEEVLSPLGIKALFFVPTGFVELSGNGSWRDFAAQKIYEGRISADEIHDYQRPMDWQDLLILKSQGHRIGAHTINHSRLAGIKDEKKVKKEIAECGSRLEEVIGDKVTDFAFPFGNVQSIDRVSLNLVGKYYPFCYSGVRGRNNNQTPLLGICREAISLDDPPAYLNFLIEGGLEGHYRKRRKDLYEMAFSCANS